MRRINNTPCVYLSNLMSLVSLFDNLDVLNKQQNYSGVRDTDFQKMPVSMRALRITFEGKRCGSGFLSLYRPLGEFSLQCAAVHIQGASRGRDIPVMLVEHLLQVLPFQALY